MSNCIFCKIINGEIPSKQVYADEDVVVFHDISPKAPVHVLVVPKKHVESLREVEEADTIILSKLLLTVKQVGETLGISEKGYKVVVNNGPDSGQLVYHLHFHLLGGWKGKAGWEV